MKTLQPLAIGYLAFALLFLGFGTWSTVTEIRGAVVAPGMLVVEGRRHVVEHASGGLVRSILVADGDHVNDGDLLIQLDTTDADADLAQLDNQLVELLVRRDRLSSERDGLDDMRSSPEVLDLLAARSEFRGQRSGQEQHFRIRLATFRENLRMLADRRKWLDGQIEQALIQISALEGKLANIDLELELQKKLLSRGVVSEKRVRDVELQRADASAALASAEGMVISLRSERARLLGEKTRLVTERTENAVAELRDLDAELKQLREQRRTAQNSLDRLSIRAPRDGLVHGMQVFGNGDVLKPAEPILYVVPRDERLRVLARVPDADREDVASGQNVTLQFSTLDQRNMPEVFGTIVNVSADRFQDETNGFGYYEVSILFEYDHTIGLGLDLRPGMPVLGFIQTKARTPWLYLSQPVRDFISRMFID